MKTIEKNYPQYLDELRGIAEGSKVPFFKLFLLHIDEIISSLSGKEPHGGRLGSTSIICDQETKVRITVLLCTIVSRTNSLMGFKGINLRNTYRNIVNLKT